MMINPVRRTATAIIATVDDDCALVLTLLGLPIPLRAHIFNYLGETQDELMNLALVSKQVYTDCYRLGIEWKIIPTIEISPTKGRSKRTLLQQLLHNKNNETNKKLRRFPRMHVNNVHKFYLIPLYRLAAEITRDVRKDWIVSLDILLSRRQLEKLFSCPFQMPCLILCQIYVMLIFQMRIQLIESSRIFHTDVHIWKK
jgi:hypothetical protein